MAFSLLHHLLLLLALLFLSPQPPPTRAAAASSKDDASPYYSKSTLFSDYEKMLKTFKIFIYPTPTKQQPLNLTLTAPPLSFLHSSLLRSARFLTSDPGEAHLFLLPFPPNLSARSLARAIQDVRGSHPHWDRSLGADHVYLACHGAGAGPTSSRGVVELRKNAVGVKCFPSPPGEFIPHKDVSVPPPPAASMTLPSAAAWTDQLQRPIHTSNWLKNRDGVTTRRLGYWKYNPKRAHSKLMSDLKTDPDFLIESELSDEGEYLERLSSSKFCLFGYDNVGEVDGLYAALAHGCVPVVITDRPTQDLPLMDVIRWSEIALFVGSTMDVKSALSRASKGGVYERMRRSGVAVAHHFAWNEPPQPYDAFHMVMYQLWLRRHAIRYARWEGA